MASFVTRMREEYEPYADHRTKYWLLINENPVPVWLLTVAYLLMVFLGPKFMKHREPFKLKWLMVVYNLGLVGLSLYMFIEIILSTLDAKYDYVCASYNEETKKDPKEYRVACVLWWYFFSKVIELNDTVLMVLRKNNRQITFLHVFHHAAMLNIWWWVMMFIPTGQSYFGACLNCLVHVVMYSYYGLSVFPSLRKKMWWKRYITRFQLVQFVITLSHTLRGFYVGCDFPLWGQYLLGGLMVIMLILFTNFYVRAYITSKEESRKTQPKSTVYDNGSSQSNGAIIEGKILTGHKKVN